MRRWLGSGWWGEEAWRCHLRLDGLAPWEPLASSGRLPCPADSRRLASPFPLQSPRQAWGPGPPASATTLQRAGAAATVTGGLCALAPGSPGFPVPALQTDEPGLGLQPCLSFTLRPLPVPQFLSRKDQVIPRLLRRTVARINRRTALSTGLGSREGAQPMPREPGLLRKLSSEGRLQAPPSGSRGHRADQIPTFCMGLQTPGVMWSSRRAKQGERSAIACGHTAPRESLTWVQGCRSGPGRPLLCRLLPALLLQLDALRWPMVGDTSGLDEGVLRISAINTVEAVGLRFRGWAHGRA